MTSDHNPAIKGPRRGGAEIIIIITRPQRRRNILTQMGGTCPGRTRAPLALRTVASRRWGGRRAPDQRAARKGPGRRREMTLGGGGNPREYLGNDRKSQGTALLFTETGSWVTRRMVRDFFPFKFNFKGRSPPSRA